MQIDFEKIRLYDQRPTSDLVESIHQIKKKYGKDLCILAHLYQRKEITDLADFTGDSYGLSKSAAEFEGGKYIVFCGVRFMAESAEILSRPDQKVIHPDPEAGCPMADMASFPEVSRAWDALSLHGKVVPITYMNSTAEIKAFCGKNGGTICTSSNAKETFKWGYQRGEKIFFLPDEHLGRNTGLASGIKIRETAIWDPEIESGGFPQLYPSSKLILWRGHCPVHTKFTLRDVEHVRKFFPRAKIVVHPECPKPVVDAADAVGSTSYIRDWVKKNTKSGEEVFIGTEINLVENLAKELPDRKIQKLHRSLCLTMYQITLGRLLYSLENLESLEPVSVPESIKHYSKLALNRMLSI